MSWVWAHHPHQVYGGNWAGRREDSTAAGFNLQWSSHNTGQCIRLQQKGQDTGGEDCGHLSGAFRTRICPSEESLLSKSNWMTLWTVQCVLFFISPRIFWQLGTGAPGSGARTSRRAPSCGPGGQSSCQFVLNSDSLSLLQLIHGEPYWRVLEPHPALRLLHGATGRGPRLLGHPLPAEGTHLIYQSKRVGIFGFWFWVKGLEAKRRWVLNNWGNCLPEFEFCRSKMAFSEFQARGGIER